METRFGKADETWSVYNLLQVPLLYNNRASGYKAIVKNGKLVAILGQDYKVLPKES